MKKINKKQIVIFLIIISILSALPLFFTNTLKYGHDLDFHLARIISISNELKVGNIFSSIYPNYLYGYGYANGLFYPDIFLYIPAILNTLGIDIFTSYKIFIIIINLLTTFSMYYVIKKITKNDFSAIITSLIYAFSSYRLVDLFERSALGEVISFIFIPLVILGIYYIIYDDYKKWHILTIGMTGLILSHLISVYIIVILLVILCLINIKRLLKEKERILAIIKAAFITILVTSFFIFPMFEQMLKGDFKFHHMEDFNNMQNRSVPFLYLFLNIPNNLKPWIPSGIGLIFIIAIIYKFVKKPKLTPFANICFYLGLIFLFLSSNLFPWQFFEFLNMIQFPWRFYLIVILLLTIFISFLVKNIKNKKMVFIITLFLSLISLFTHSYNSITKSDIKEVYYHIANGEYLPYGVSSEDIKKRSNIITSNNDISVEFKRDNTFIINITNNNYDNTFLELPLLYYDGYVALSNNKNLNVLKSDNGYLKVLINDLNNETINVYYKGTTIRNISRYISLITVIIIMSYFVIKRIKFLKNIA